MILSDHVVISQCVGHLVICSGDGTVKTKYLDKKKHADYEHLI